MRFETTVIVVLPASIAQLASERAPPIAEYGVNLEERAGSLEPVLEERLHLIDDRPVSELISSGSKN